MAVSVWDISDFQSRQGAAVRDVFIRTYESSPADKRTMNHPSQLHTDNHTTYYTVTFTSVRPDLLVSYSKYSL